MSTTNLKPKQLLDGWIWEDIGNYYGAGVSGLNWHENQYDRKIKIARGREGDSVENYRH